MTSSMSTGNTSGLPSREEIAQREIGRTDISAGLAWLLIVAFLLTIALPPTVQLAYDVGVDNTRRAPACLQLLYTLPEVTDVFRQTAGGVWNRLTAANRRLLRNVEDYERQLEDRSLLTRRLLGRTQYALTEWSGLGNEQVYIGRGGWLFYRPDVDALTGPGFLVPAVLERRARGGQAHAAPPAPDPRPAIIEFHEQLARRGISLVLLPTPGKAAIHPETLSSRFDRGGAPLANASFEQFQRDVAAAGVLLFDSAPLLAEQSKSPSAPRLFLQTDTHWTPTAMEFVAARLKTYLDEHCPLPARPSAAFVERRLEIENRGDVAGMLRLPESQTLFPHEAVSIRQITGSDGEEWAPDESADVLLLGDSYTNIYSLPEMKWGATAGLAEQLSFVLQRPVDRLAQNDGGSLAVRQALNHELARGRDRLAGKRIVIWQFAVRELALGDWRVLPLPEHVSPGDRAPHGTPEIAAGEIRIQGIVRAAAGAPNPGSVPYRDAVTAVHLDTVEAVDGELPNREIVVYLWGLQDNRLTNGARFAPGQRVSLRVVPWEVVRDKYERFNRIELDDPDFRLVELPAYWAEEVP